MLDSEHVGEKNVFMKLLRCSTYKVMWTQKCPDVSRRATEDRLIVRAFALRPSRKIHQGNMMWFSSWYNRNVYSSSVRICLFSVSRRSVQTCEVPVQVVTIATITYQNERVNITVTVIADYFVASSLRSVSPNSWLCHLNYFWWPC